MLVSALTVGCGRTDERRELRVAYSYPRSLVVGFAHPTGPPPGADIRTCRPSREHPRPVVLVHGTFNNRASTWNALSPLLKNQGYCVFSLNYGARSKGSPFGATEPIDDSARELARFVDRVLRLTGAEKVDIVGYSQGGMMPRQYVKFHGGSTKLGSLIALAPSNRGTTSGLSETADRIAGNARLPRLVRRFMRRLADTLDRACEACAEQRANSPFLRRLNNPYRTLPGIRYTVIASRFDQVVTPYRRQFLLPAPNVTNITLQKSCALDKGDHLSMPFDSIALHHVTNALDPGHATPPRCVRIRPGIGG